MNFLNETFHNQLDLTITIFQNKYYKKFLHELVSGQLDMDRLDYLKRDSFFTGVNEGVIGEDRIIKMLNVRNDSLVSEQKGIYSIERFLTARRLMYWQVYFHKTVIASEILLENLLLRAKDLAKQGVELFATPSLHYFLYESYNLNRPEDLRTAINHFINLDDNDIFTSAKEWSTHTDKILADLSQSLLNRKLNHVEISDHKIDHNRNEKISNLILKRYNLKSRKDIKYYFTNNIISNHTYAPTEENIRILMNNGDIKDLHEVSDIINLGGLTKITEKYFLCYPKEITEF
jgi:hypothetical protein